MIRCRVFCWGLIAALLLPNVLFAQDAVDASLDSLLQIPITTAAKYWQTIEEAPASVSIITSSQIERFGYRTLEDVLRSVRGFYISNDHNYTYVGVRGFSRPTDYNNRVLLLLNGHTTNENVYGSSAFGADFGLSLDMVDRIEIVRGPGSALYGTSAMFAVVNVITKKGLALDGFRSSVSAGSFGLYEGSLIWGKEYDSELDVFLGMSISDYKGDDLYFSEYDTDSTNNGIAGNLDWERYWGLFTRMSYGDFTLQAKTTQRKKGVPSAGWGTAFNNPGFYTLDKLQLVELLWNHSFSNTQELTIRGYYDRYGYEGTYPYDTPLTDGT
ncbi:MAG: TonB-dependent receptor plug domain-containing protein, partial [Nitrososphaera sp.]|nr:TonB-dependent receptor plug domain-containing protein [Nitrososphaera sp.]